MPDQIIKGQSCELKVEIRNNSGSEILVNKRLAIGYRNSLSRELYLTITDKHSAENVGLQKVLYERKFSSSSDFIWLLPQQQISTQFNLFDWYEIPSSGTYTIQIFYQADEELAFKPEGLCRGVFSSEEKILTVLSK
jgi:hypothetical protein